MAAGYTTHTEAGRKNDSCEETPMEELKARKSLKIFVIAYAKRGSMILSLRNIQQIWVFCLSPAFPHLTNHFSLRLCCSSVRQGYWCFLSHSLS